MPLSVMRSVKSELLTPWKGQPVCWEYLLRMFLTSKKKNPPSCSSFPGRIFLNSWHWQRWGGGLWKMTRGSTVVPSPAAHLSRSTTRISHANSTNSGNAKMLMPTFTGGSEVGLFKQREVCKVRERITHSRCASEGHTSVNRPKCAVILDSSMKSVEYWACNQLSPNPKKSLVILCHAFGYLFIWWGSELDRLFTANRPKMSGLCTSF